MLQDGTKFYESLSKNPSDVILGSLYKLRVRQSAQFKTVLELYDVQIHQKRSVSKLSKVETHGEEEVRMRILDDVEGRKGCCSQWKERRHVRNETVENENTFPPHLLSPASRGRSPSKKRSIRGKSNHGSILRQPSARVPTFTKQKRDTKLG